MLKYFSKKDNLSDVIDYMSTKIPKIVLLEYNCLIDNRLLKRDDDNEMYVIDKLKNFINDARTIEFKIFDNKFKAKEIEDGLKVNNLYEVIISQEELGLEFYEKFESVIQPSNNIWSIQLDDYKKNNLLYAYISEQYFQNIEIYVLFSTLTDAVSFLLVHTVPENVKIIVFDIQTRYSHLKDSVLSLLTKK
jgi:hypothetical protein